MPRKIEPANTKATSEWTQADREDLQRQIHNSRRRFLRRQKQSPTFAEMQADCASRDCSITVQHMRTGQYYEHENPAEGYLDLEDSPMTEIDRWRQGLHG